MEFAGSNLLRNPYELESSPKKSFKWMPCKFYREGEPNSCRVGTNCGFAHGDLELIERPPRQIDPNAPRGVKRSAETAKLLCMHNLRGTCDKGDECSFSHDREEFKKSLPANYKTTLCSSYMGTGNCKRAEACGFAHGRYELRPYGYKGDFEEKIKESPNWKTVMCQFFMKSGECRNKTECPYAHGEKELRMMKQSPYENAPNVLKAGIATSTPVPLCRFFSTGNCKLGTKCAYSHGQDSLLGDPNDQYGGGGYQMLDYTSDYVPSTVNMIPPQVELEAPSSVPGISLSKDEIYSEFMDFLSQKFTHPASSRQPSVMGMPQARPVMQMPGNHPRAAAVTGMRNSMVYQGVPAGRAMMQPGERIVNAAREAMVPRGQPRVNIVPIQQRPAASAGRVVGGARQRQNAMELIGGFEDIY